MLKFKRKVDLDKIFKAPNVVELMDEKDVVMVGHDVIAKYTLDKESNMLWEELTDRALDLAKLKHEMKHTPWPNASNVKYPLISMAVIQFASREYPELIRNDKVVGCRVCGEDPTGEKADRAKNISSYMSYQLLYEMEGWEKDLDKLLHMLATVGTVFKKVYYDPVEQKPVSELCEYKSVIVHRDTPSLIKARRITHQIYVHSNEILSASRQGIYIELEEDELRRESVESEQEDAMHCLLEQHRYLDLDGDGYEEPYIVIVDQDLGKVLRIVARWDEGAVIRNEKQKIQKIIPVQYFVDYHYIPNPDGSFLSLGIGQLMYPLNKTANSLVNQLIDAGTLATMPGGFIGRALKLPGGTYKFKPGQWEMTAMSGVDDIRKQIVPLPHNEPSPVLFQLLGMIIEASKELSSSTNALLGTEQVQNVSTTAAMAQIEQGGKVHGAIHKRTVASMKSEFELLFRLNRIFLDPKHYYAYLDTTRAIQRDDFEDESMDIHPVADPSVSSDTHRMAVVRAGLEPITAIPNSGINTYEALHRYFEALQIPNIDKILPPPNPNAPPPPEILKLQAELQEMGINLDIKKQETEEHAKDVLIRAHLAESQMTKDFAQSELLLAQKDLVVAQAEATRAQAFATLAKPSVDAYAIQVEELKTRNTLEQDIGNPESTTSAQLPLPEGPTPGGVQPQDPNAAVGPQIIEPDS